MRRINTIAAILAVSSALAVGGKAAPAIDDGGWINRITVDRLVPPPPAAGSRTEEDEIAEIHRVQARATPEALAAAKHDNDVEDATIFTAVIGPNWNIAKLPKTAFLIQRIMYVDRPDSGSAKRFYHRSRPWIVDPTIHTCAAHDPGPAQDSYPSGHTMLGFELAVVLASLIPEKAQALLARAENYGENRILCGFHFRSDVTAGQQFGTVLAVEMLQHPRFHGWFLEAREELIAAGIAQPDAPPEVKAR
jgi:acid phosphatase (class A)